jgi:dihydroorotate dehydrogenase
MDLYGLFLRSVGYRCDPEWIHDVAMRLIERGLIPTHFEHDESLACTVSGVKFPNPIGLAAGFDKNARAIGHWHRFGFGFVEIGTVTLRPQPGNPRPRLFRLPADRALINRMGFNNDGAEVVAERLSSTKARIPVGINLGKNKETPAAKAASEYAESFRILLPYGDYFVINVSSPNTPGLRTLQEKGPLLDIAQALREVSSAKPVFVKIAPDLELPAIDDVLDVAVEARLAGIIATNTTIKRDGLRSSTSEVGGLSGAPLKQKSDEVLEYLNRHRPKYLTLIGVGGVSGPSDVADKFTRGANLVQLYTGWVYGGPATVPRLFAGIPRTTVPSTDGA